MKSPMTHLFSRVPNVEIPRSSFDRSHGHKTTFDAGYLIPVYVDEVLPGDSFNLRMAAFARLATPIKPIMDNMYMDSFFFFVPNRLLWDNWEKFNGAQDNPGDSTDFTIPEISGTNVAVGTLWDYFGLPTGVANALTVNSLHFRAYNLIYNTWFRDENIQSSVHIDKGNGPDSLTNYDLKRRGKRHDYFTSALPFPQKGPDVDLPLGTTAPLVAGTDGPSWKLTDGSNVRYLRLHSGFDQWEVGDTSGSVSTPGNTGKAVWNQPDLHVDLTSATAAPINAIREAFQVQRMYERDARGGTRYTEIVKSHFGVTSPDARLQRPEYLGGGSSPINFHPVAQTAQDGAGVYPQGNLAAFATAAFNGHGFSKSFTEHGVIIGLVSVRADLTYQQGINRMWSRQTRFDYYWPTLSHLGEQEVLNKEIYAQGTSDDAAVFGYQERYAEYRYKPPQISGKFRSTYAQPLDYWHLAQKFTSLPTLSDFFINENPPVTRVIAVTTEPQFLFDSHFSLKCARPMPVYGVPGMIDHF